MNDPCRRSKAGHTCACMCPCMYRKPKLHGKDHEVCENKDLKGKKKIKTEQAQCGRAEAVATTAQQGACCMISQPFADGASPALLFLPPLSPLVLSPSQASCSPHQQGRCCDHSLEACCQNVLGSKEEGLSEDASPEPHSAARFAQGPTTGAACGRGMLQLTETGRAGGPSPSACQREATP